MSHCLTERDCSSGRINSTSPSGARFRVYASTREVNHLFIQGPRLSSETASPLAYRLADRSHLFTPEVRRHTVAQVAQVALSAESHPALRSPPHVCDRDRNRNRQPDSKYRCWTGRAGSLIQPLNKLDNSTFELVLLPTALDCDLDPRLVLHGIRQAASSFDVDIN